VVNIQPERCWQNTDPLVFGDRFRYAICRQVTRRGNRARASLLENGDIILFGSRKGGQFALDSVFVVGQYSDFYSLDDLPTWESDLHRRIAAERAPPPPCGFRLYSGRTWSPSDPFSYVPCLPVTDEPIAHPRPSIKPVGVLEGIISPGMTQNFNETPVDAVRARAIWEAVTDQVLRQGCALGVAIDEPGWVNT
jgi:hypothetical protein